jgi:hypothetical protein
LERLQAGETDLGRGVGSVADKFRHEVVEEVSTRDDKVELVRAVLADLFEGIEGALQLAMPIGRLRGTHLGEVDILRSHSHRHRV